MTLTMEITSELEPDSTESVLVQKKVFHRFVNKLNLRSPGQRDLSKSFR